MLGAWIPSDQSVPADRPPLPDVRPIDGVSVGRHVVDAQCDEVATAQLLSMAKLNIAKPRVRFSRCGLARITQTRPGRSGGLVPVSFPLFQVVRRAAPLDVTGLLTFIANLRGSETAKTAALSGRGSKAVSFSSPANPPWM